ncbi:DNA damage-inducible protein 1 [Ancistrocladus abbreviatus]
MEFLFGLDMLRKHQCIIDLKDNVLRVGGGEVSVPFLQEKDIPSSFMDEERYSKQASNSGAPVSSRVKDMGNQSSGNQTSGADQGNPSQVADFEAKVSRLVELGFERNSVVQALKLFDGNEGMAGSFLFGG